MKKLNHMANILLHVRLVLVVLLQAGLIFCSLLCSWLLRFEFRVPAATLLLTAAPILIIVRLSFLPFFNLTHGCWRYAGISDALDVLKAILAGSAAFFVVMRFGLGLTVFPLSIYALEALITFTLLSGVRLISRMRSESIRRNPSNKRLLLVGAGHAARIIIRETRQVETGYTVIGCVDDDPLKQNIKLLGVPVLGTVGALQKIASKHKLDEVLIAVPSSTPAEMLRFVEACKEAGVSFRTVPNLAELISGHVILPQVREVRLEDLLGRKPISLDLEPVRAQIRDRVVMVTGAAGSIGSELCRQILRCDPKLLLCVDQNETGIFHLEQELAKSVKRGQCVFCVADFCNAERMRKLFLAHRTEIVFHAAAYKHVPVMEANIEEAVSNNVFGLLALLNVAHQSSCGTFVLISSDKAVNPTSVMGCTKRVGELMLAAWCGESLRCVSVRFGNVLGTNGSVIPLFQEQILRNEAIKITHPEITRFFMTISEAVSLVLQAFAVGKHGDTLVLDMGEPIRILDLAKTLIRLSGKIRHDIEFMGLRPGEKLFEELFYSHERVLPTLCEKVKCTESVPRRWPELKLRLDRLYVAMCTEGPVSILERLREIVPQFSYASHRLDQPEEMPAAAPTTEVANEKPPLLDPPAWPSPIWQVEPLFLTPEQAGRIEKSPSIYPAPPPTHHRSNDWALKRS
jgi:FlaA1/EpsC-like NDP-sugar epimerase